MLLYRAVVMNAMTDVIEPALRKAVHNALSSQYGAAWFQTVGIDVMQTYSSFSDMESALSGGVNAIDAMDIPAIIYLLKPKKNEDDEEEFESENGLMPDVANFYGWDGRAVSSILRIRYIRNKCFHDKLEPRFQPSEQTIKSGIQEKIWLNDLELALKHLDSSADLSSYKDELLEKILKEENKKDGNPNTKKDVDPAVLSYIREVESVRSQYMKIKTFAFSEAPIKEAISGAAPWADAGDDLSRLSWPSEELSGEINGQNVNMDNAAQNMNQGGSQGSTVNSSNDMFNKAADSLDKGVSKLFNWLNKKK